MAFRLIVSELPDLTTMRLAGRLGDDAVAALNDACHHARRPLVLDLSQLTGASDAAVLLLHRLTGEGIHLLGASQYVTLLLTAEELPAIARQRPWGRRPQGPSRQAPRPRKARPSGAVTADAWGGKAPTGAVAPHRPGSGTAYSHDSRG